MIGCVMKKILNLINTLSLIAGFLCPQGVMAGTVKGRTLENDGRISIFNYHEKEFAEITYREGGKYDPQALKTLEHLMRSRGDGATHTIDIGVIEILDHLQDHFDAETVELISGYRSPAYNKSLRMNGRGAASESLHMQGLAADIHLDEVSEAVVFDYLRKLGLGGAGLYPRHAFVHADVGPPRTWEEKALDKRMLIGTQNNPNAAWTAVTDKNVYAPGQDVTVKITNNDYSKMKFTTNAWYEYFRKGAWNERKNLVKDKGAVKLNVGESTEYLWKIPADQGLGKYRLVFFTSKDFSIPPVYSNEFYVRKR
jgi:uncharacterized protein YcbK (DUF882 family)